MLLLASFHVEAMGPSAEMSLNNGTANSVHPFHLTARHESEAVTVIRSLQTEYPLYTYVKFAFTLLP